jgi:hypothetical protein
MNRRTFLFKIMPAAVIFPSYTTWAQTRTPQLFPYPPPTEEATRRGEAGDADLTRIVAQADEEAKVELLDSGEPAIIAREQGPADIRAAVHQWRIALGLLALRSTLHSLAPDRNTRDDGFIGDPAHQTRKSDHNPWVLDGRVGVVTAYDITHSPTSGCDNNVLADKLVSSRDQRIKYIIWNKRIINSEALKSSPAWQWRDYHGQNPHTAHLHLSVLPAKSLYDNETAWSITVA